MSYVTGLLVRNEHGAAAPGSSVAVDRWLTIQTSTGITIRVFDYTHLPVINTLLSEQEGIREGNTYSFLLTVLAHNIERTATTRHPLQGQKVWQGTVVEALWVLPQQAYLAVDPEDLETFQGILVETSIGQVIIPPSRVDYGALPSNLEQGESLRWDHIRFSLLAILKSDRRLEVGRGAETIRILLP
jgi:hypothetical protein